MLAHRPALTDLTDCAQRYLDEILCAGDLAVDLTAGRGRDCLHLARQVDSNNSGTLLAFDIQNAAITASLALLAEHGLRARQISRPQQLEDHGIFLVEASHERLELFLPRAPQAVIANFGYLPGGDHTITTTATASCSALSQAFHWLAAGGRLAMVLYTGHPGAHQECAAIEELCRQLDPQHWRLLRIQPGNCVNAPYLLVAEKRAIKGADRK